MSITPASAIVSKERAPCYYIKIAGIPVLYGSVMPPPESYDLDGVATPYERRVSIIPGQGMRFERRLNVREGVIECRPCEVVLASNELDTDTDVNDPGRVFGRLGFAGADASEALAPGQSITQTEAMPRYAVFENDPSSHFSQGDVLHIGQEAFLCGHVNGTAKTIHLTQRAVLGTRKGDHLYDTTTQVQLMATRPAVYFKGRRAVIYEGVVRADGTGGDWVEKWRGFMASEPEISTSGRVPTVTLKISPLTALLDLQMGTQAQDLHLSTKAHCLTYGAGHHLDFLERIRQASIVSCGTGLRESYRALWHGTGHIPISNAGFNQVNAVRSIQLASTAHPLGIPVRLRSGGEPTRTMPYRVKSVKAAYYPGDSDFAETSALELTERNEVVSTGGGAPLATGGISMGHEGASIVNADGSFWRDVSLYDSSGSNDSAATLAGTNKIIGWPGALINLINSTGDTVGTPGGWSSRGWKSSGELTRGAGLIKVHLDLSAGSLRFSCKVPLLEGNPIEAHFGYADVPFMDLEHQWTHNANRKRWGQGSSGLVALERRPAYERLSPRVFGVADQDEENAVAVTIPGGGAYIDTPVRVARCWYHRGENALLVDGPVSVPTDGHIYLTVEHPDDGVLGVLRVSGSETVTLDDQSEVTKLTTDGRDYGQRGGLMQTFAEYSGQDRIKLKTTAVFTEGAPIGVVLLQLLCSSGGNRLTSTTYDVLPYGAGLSDGTSSAASSDPIGSEVDVESFLSIPDPFPSATFRPMWTAGQPIKEVIGGLLRACGYVIDIVVTDAGKCVIKAVPLGLPNRADVVDQLGLDDIAASPNPRSDTELTKANVYEFQFDHQPDGSFTSQRVRDAVSVDVVGEEKSIKVPLPGVTLSDDLSRVAQLRPIFSRLRFELGFPRRVFEMTIRSGAALQAIVGGTYNLTHPHLMGPKMMGVTNELVRLRSITENGWQPGARARFVLYGASGTGWGPSMSVTGVIDAHTLEVDTDKHSGASTIDADGFRILQVGDRVVVQVRGDMDNVLSTTVQEITDTTIKLGFAHNITDDGSAVLGYVTPMREDLFTVPDAHDVYAYIGEVMVI